MFNEGDVFIQAQRKHEIEPIEPFCYNREKLSARVTFAEETKKNHADKPIKTK